ncbi:MAG: hypothetical protein ACI8RN_002115 [Glaciecola sp.]|jgi:hypothetical protein
MEIRRDDLWTSSNRRALYTEVLGLAIARPLRITPKTHSAYLCPWI